MIRRCLELGREARANGGAPVGSLVVFDGQVIGSGVEAVRTMHDPSAHAEIIAIRAACQKLKTRDLSGSTLYPNVEPCVMCSYAIRRARVSRVVFGLSNTRVGGVSSQHAILTDGAFGTDSTPPEIREGVLSDECSALLRESENRS